VADRQIENLTPQVVAAHGQAFGPQVRQYHGCSCCRRRPTAAAAQARARSVVVRPNLRRHTQRRNARSERRDQVERRRRGAGEIVASRFVSGSLVRQRPVCPYPRRRVYNGVGSIDSADSFTCQTPVLQERNVGAGDLLHVLNSLRQRELLLPNR